MFPANWPIVVRKSPKRMNRPYSSIRKPVSGQRKRMRRIPKTKAAVPLSFWRREKKAKVFSTPIMRVRPMRKRIWRWVSGRSIYEGFFGSVERTFPIASLWEETRVSDLVACI